MAVALVNGLPVQAGGAPGTSVYSAYNGIQYSSSYGNALLIVGTYDQAVQTGAPLPFMTPCDSAGNLYIPLGQLPAIATNASQARQAAWICPNARPISWASVSCGTIVSASISAIYEFSGIPAWAQLSMTTLYGGGTSAAPSLSGPANSASFCIGMLSTSNTSATLTGPSGWTTKQLGVTGTTNGITSILSYMTTSSSGTVTYSPTLTSSAYTIMLAAITMSPVAPTQPTTQPRFIYEAQFGRSIGDLQTAPYSPGPVTAVLTAPYPPSATPVTSKYTVPSTGGISLLAIVIVPAVATIDLTDTAGNTFTNIGYEEIPGGGVAYAYYCLDPLSVGVNDALTLTMSVMQAALVTVVSCPGVWQLDTVSPPSTGTSTSPTASTGALSSPMDLEVALFTTDSDKHITGTPSGWAEVGQYTDGNLTSDLYYRVSTPGAGFNANGPGDTVSGTYGSSTGWGCAIFAFKVIGWTDISEYVQNGAGAETLRSTQGRPYELSQPEAGEISIRLDDHAGQFFANNPDSPFYPGVLAETPVRVTCIDQGRQYPVTSGYVDSWPLEWPDLEQWTITQISATDTVELLTNSQLPSGLQCEIRNDYPYVYFPGNEQYSTQVTSQTSYVGSYSGLNNTKQPSECAGLPAINASLYNQRNGFYADGGATIQVNPSAFAACQTGLSMGYLGTQDTGFGQSSYPQASTPQTEWTPRGPGIVYNDLYGLPAASLLSTGVTLEWFCQVPGQSTNAPVYENVTLFEAVNQPSNFQSSTTVNSDLFVYTNYNSNTNMQIACTAGPTGAYTELGTYMPNYNNNGTTTALVLHCVLRISNGGTYAFILNGNTVSTGTLTCTGSWTEFRLGGAKGRYGQPPWLYNYVMGHFALYPYILPIHRVVAHYQMGISTGLPVPMGTEEIGGFDYMAATLAYSRVPAQAAGPGSNYLPDVGQMGPMYSVDNASAMDTANTAVQSEGGLIYVDKQCSTVVLGRNATYNLPSFVTFGDNGTTQIPYMQQSGFGYDDQYLYTLAQVQQETGATEGVLAQAENLGGNLLGQVQYGTRSAPSVTAEVNQANDAIDQVNWRLNKYATPQFRLKSIVVDAASLVGGAIDTALASRGGVIGVLMSCNIGTVVTVTRTPLGANTTVNELGIIDQVNISSGPSLLQFEFMISPYAPESDILQADNTADGSSGEPVNQLGYGSLAW